ncbi:MAG: S1C family serine protease [Candidatus Binatia bacterium]
MNASIHLLRQVLPSVVRLKARIPEDHPSTVILGAEREGTATVVDPRGLALTANYLVIGAEIVEVTRFDGETVTADVIGRDYSTGLAVLQLAGTPPVAIPLRASSDLDCGEDVFLVGSSGDAGPRVSSGGVSYLGAFDAYWEYQLDRAIMTTAMNPGLGGGPLCDRLGRMVGVVSLNLNEIGRFSMAIPVECFLDRRDRLVSGRGGATSGPSRAWIGLYCTTLHEHVVIAGLMPGSPGETAGLRTGDVLLAVDGVKIDSRIALYRQIWTHPSGERVSFRIFRNNEVRTIEVESIDVEEMFG